MRHRLPPPASIARMDYFVYLLANRRQGALYVGVTNNLVRRVHEHREGLAEGFTKRYGIKMLVWFESTPSVEAAIAREKQLKNWKRQWKVALIETENREWRDLYPSILG
jgi:putative endonuclease